MSFKPALLRGAAATSCLLFSLLAAAAALKADPAKSSIGVLFRQMNVPIEAKFNQATMQINFDAAHLEASKARVEIDIASFDLGEPEYNREVLKKEWFNAAQFPKATFVSSNMKAMGNNQYQVNGQLTIKGRATEVAFPLTVSRQGTQQIFDGRLPIKRLTYNIGEGDWKDTSVVADEVVIKFHIVAAE
ncbi:MAG: YceI family protein [Burkholderiaceae bacterium]|nr:MAG: YceI family protein [Burkholderiaceae bacterium]